MHLDYCYAGCCSAKKGKKKKSQSCFSFLTLVRMQFLVEMMTGPSEHLRVANCGQKCLQGPFANPAGMKSNEMECMCDFCQESLVK